MAGTGRFPAEIWLMIVDHLQRDDLLNICAVNTALRSLARPLLYRFGTFSRFGLRFPGAESPFPLTHLPEFGQPIARKSQQRAILNVMRRLDVKVHRKRECDMFAMLWPKERTLFLDVLWLELVRCPEVNVAHHCRPWFPASFVHNDVTEDPGPGRGHLPHVDSQCMRHCSYLTKGELWEARVRKVVIRGAQVMWDRHAQECQVPGGIGVTDLVVVVDSTRLWRKHPDAIACLRRLRQNSHSVFRPDDPEFEVEQRLGEGEFRWGFAPLDILSCMFSIRSLTIVFWTGAPGVPWVPPCGHFHGRGEAMGAPNTCLAYSRMWSDVVGIARDTAIEHIVVVNTDSLAPLRDAWNLVDPTQTAPAPTQPNPITELQQRINRSFEGRVPREPSPAYEPEHADSEVEPSESDHGELQGEADADGDSSEVEPSESDHGELQGEADGDGDGDGSEWDWPDWDGWTPDFESNLRLARPPQLLMPSMAEWIESGAWEDVFSRKEIQPYLNAVR